MSTYNKTEALLAEQHAALIAAMAAAVRAGMPKAEAARRAGYSREHASKLIDAYEEQVAAQP